MNAPPVEPTSRDMREGHMYLVVYQFDYQRFPRYMVASYLGETQLNEWQFNGRPAFGTSTLDKRAVLDVRPLIPSAKGHKVADADARKIPGRFGGPHPRA